MNSEVKLYQGDCLEVMVIPDKNEYEPLPMVGATTPKMCDLCLKCNAEYIEWLEKYGSTIINRTLIKAMIIFMNFIDKQTKV